MIIQRPKEYIVTKDTELTVSVRLYYQTLKESYGQTGRITDIVQMLEKLSLKKFELFDPKTWNSGLFSSYLLDQQIKFQKGEPLDMVVLHNDILKVYEFTSAEKKQFINEIVEEKIWAIFKYVTDPNLVINNN
jgi:hypothetical protein